MNPKFIRKSGLFFDGVLPLCVSEKLPTSEGNDDLWLHMAVK
jgi:hypothetical protein